MTTQTELAKDLRSLLCANADFYSNGGESLPQAAYDAQVGVKEGAFLLKWSRALAASAGDAAPAVPAAPQVAAPADEREAFEAWVKRTSTGEPDFQAAAAMWAWAAWQAALAAAPAAPGGVPAAMPDDKCVQCGAVLTDDETEHYDDTCERCETDFANYPFGKPRAPAPVDGGAAPEQPRPMDNAPKDGTLLRLLVKPETGSFTAFDDSLEPSWTIGFNNRDDTGEDRWQFAGWSWTHDCIVEGFGEPIGWLPMLSAAPVVDGGAAGVRPITLNGYQLRDALEFLAPDGTDEQLEQDVCIQYGSARTVEGETEPAGAFCWLSDYPEEGAIRLDDEPAADRSARAGAPGEAACR